MTEVKRDAKGKDGIRFERYIIERFGLEEEKNPTHQWDAYVRNEERTPVSIKLAGLKNEIVFSNIFPHYGLKQDFFLVLGVWDEHRDVARFVYVLKIKAQDWRALFNSRDAMVTFKTMLKLYNGRIGDEDRYKWALLRDAAYDMFKKDTPGLIKPRARFVSPSKKEREKMKESNPGKSLNDIEYDKSKYGTHRIQCACSTRNFIVDFIYRQDRSKVKAYTNIKF